MPNSASRSAVQQARAAMWFPAGLWINGCFEDSAAGADAPVIDPATGDEIARVPVAAEGETRRAIDAAATAFDVWRRRSPGDRSEVLWRIHRLLVEHREKLAAIRTGEQGSPLAQSRGEVDFAAGYFRWYAEEANRIYGRAIPHPEPARRMLVTYIPTGIVGAITPWNAPLSAPARKIAAALAAGCTIILKPSEITPISAMALADITSQAGLPAGAFNVVFGDAPAIGRTLVEDERVRLITFTGSVRTGRHLAGEAGKRLKRVALELGGNAPFIVCADADLEQAAEDLVRMKCASSGQVCVSANRVLVSRGVRDAFTELVRSRLARQVLGNGFDPETTLGPLIHEGAAEKVAELVEDAIAQGARRISGGQWPVPGLRRNFYPLTMLAEVTPGMRIFEEEIFGPVISIIDFDSDGEALRLATATAYGLAAYVYTSSIARAQRYAEGMEFGVIGINDPRPIAPEAPFGGIRQSGFGREGGTEGIMEYLEVRLIGSRF